MNEGMKKVWKMVVTDTFDMNMKQLTLLLMTVNRAHVDM
jgi:hypothetical protein